MNEFLECAFAAALVALIGVAWARWGAWIGASEMGKVNYRKQVETDNPFQHDVAEDIARRLYNAGLWDGEGVITVHEPSTAIRQVLRKGIETLVQGADYTVRIIEVEPVEIGPLPDDTPTQPDRPNRRFHWL